MKKKKIIVCILVILIIIPIVDVLAVKSGNKPIFARIFKEGQELVYVNEYGEQEYSTQDCYGLFYRFNVAYSISPTQPVSHSPRIEIGLWLFLTLEIFASKSNR